MEWLRGIGFTVIVMLVAIIILRSIVDCFIHRDQVTVEEPIGEDPWIAKIKKMQPIEFLTYVYQSTRADRPRLTRRETVFLLNYCINQQNSKVFLAAEISLGAYLRSENFPPQQK